MKLRSLGLALAFAVSLGSGYAQPGMKHEQKAAAGKEHKASGKVTKVDKAGGAVTIAHGPVASINWPSMSMRFKVKDKAMLGKDYTFIRIK